MQSSLRRIPLNFVSFVAILVVSVSFFSFGRMWEATNKQLSCVCKHRYMPYRSQDRFSTDPTTSEPFPKLDRGMVLSSKVLLSIAKRIAKANRGSTPAKARRQLTLAFAMVQSLLSGAHQNYTNSLMQKRSYDRESDSRLEVCPERYMGMKYGFPYYHTGFVTDKCAARTPPISSLVTVGLVLYFGTMPEEMPRVLGGIESSYPGITVIIGMVKETHNDEVALTKLIPKFPGISIKLHVFSYLHSEGHIWKLMADLVTSKYVLVGRRLTHFLPDAKLDRLVRVANYTQADVVGSAHRDEDGFWSHGCYLTSMKNYAYRILEGYDMSYNSCIYCDYLSGPFLTRPSVLLTHLSVDMPDGTLGWLDFFEKLKLRAQLSVLSCPDSMFLTHDNSLSQVRYKDWLQFVQAWELDFVTIPGRSEMRFAREDTNRKCGYGIHGDAGETVPPTCLRELSDMLLAFVRLCHSADIRYMIKGGTVIGAAKFSSVLPWERDEDVYYHAGDYQKVMLLTNSLTQLGYTLDVDRVFTNYTDCLATFNNDSYHEFDNCGVLALRSGNWRIQLYGVPYLDEAYWSEKYLVQNATKLRFDGQWLNAPFNPLNYARNFYGDDIFAHVEHWIGQGRNDWWNTLESGKFQKCRKPGFHGCLDRFLPTGSLQFRRDLV